MSLTQDDLFKKYPLLFSTDNRHPIVEWGIECSPGWNQLLDCVFAELYSGVKEAEHSLEFWKNVEPDVHTSREYLDAKIKASEEHVVSEKQDLPIFVQIKQKWGTLRVYSSNNNDRTDGIIALAERLSSFICEQCGNSGKLQDTKWRRSLCESCKT